MTRSSTAIVRFSGAAVRGQWRTLYFPGDPHPLDAFDVLKLPRAFTPSIWREFDKWCEF